MILEYCELKYHDQSLNAEVLSQVKEEITKDITVIEKEMLSLFYDFLHKEPYYYWDSQVFHQTTENIEYLLDNHDISITEDILEHFIYGYKNHEQNANVINDFRRLNFNPEMKTRLYRIPTYNSIVEGSLSNLFRVLTLLLDQTTAKNYGSQNNLFPLCQILESNDFDFLVKDVNVDLRNAINHGGAFYRVIHGKPAIEFQYVDKNKGIAVVHKPLYEFDELLDKLFDTSSAILLALITFFNNHKSLIDIDYNQKQFVPFSLLALRLSTPDARCRSISGLPNNKQLNIDMYIKNTERSYIHQMAIMISLMVYDRYNDYDKYMISFSGDRLASSWVRFRNTEVSQMFTDATSFGEVLEKVIKRGDSMVWNPSTEEIDLNEIKYFRFPNYKNDIYSINNVEEASLLNRKRLKANLFIGDIDKREEIIKVIRESIDWIKNLRNVPFPTFPIKHGDMEADSVYLSVYRKDTRKNKAIHISNENFVCTVDYNIDGKSTLKHGGIPQKIWETLSRETVGNMILAWRNSSYRTITQKKLGRNDPCHCGSGKKYKKCCLND